MEVSKERLEDLLADVKKAMEQPVPIQTDAFGKKYITAQNVHMGHILAETEKVLEELLNN